MLRIHYYRYDQDYSGWELWLWEKGKEGSSHMFQYKKSLTGDNKTFAAVAEVDPSLYQINEIGVILRRGSWHERDINIDRYFTFPEKALTEYYDIYLVQGEREIFTDINNLDLSPGFEIAIFQNFREIFVRLQAPPAHGTETEPFQLFEDGVEIPIRHITPTRRLRDYVISLENDMKPGSTYMIRKPGFKDGFAAYGMIYDTPEFDQLFTYEKDGLGSIWSYDSTVFKVWAPTASGVELNLYHTGNGQDFIRAYKMERKEKGIWSVEVFGNLEGLYYTYGVNVMGKTFETADPYARASGVNGERSMVIDLSKTNPEGWENFSYISLKNPTDAVLYEVHIRDITIHPSSGVTSRGRYLGLAEKDTRSPQNIPTGLSHMCELGITHVHLLPIFDFSTVDETKQQDEQYNWGYDPEFYNVPEGSYSSNPYDGYTRIKELKELIMALKSVGIGVVMDVVYNHTYKTEDSAFNKLVPGYYYRTDSYGNFSNGSGCGNEIASERTMVRNFIINSVKYWAKEYKIDGFRFDLMGLIDIETMKNIRTELSKINPSVVLYGEGWTGGHSLLSTYEASCKANASKLNNIGFFNDNTRDAIKGDAFHSEATGFITGNYRLKESVKFGVVGAVFHPQIDYTKIIYSGSAWANSPCQCINYAASHDNLTLYDKLLASRPDLSQAEHMRLINLAAAIVMTCQGIPFLMLGTDMMRTKKGNYNSYNAPDEINQIDWNLKSQYYHVFNYHKGLIMLRKKHPAFRMATAELIRQNLTFYNTSQWLIAFSLNNHANNDAWKTIFVVYNAGTSPESISLPFDGAWHIVVDDNNAGTDILGTINGNNITVPARSAMVLYQS